MHKKYYRLLEKISEAAFDDSLWVEIMNEIRIDLGGSNALLFTPEKTLEDPSGIWASPFLEPHDLEQYTSYYHTKDLWTINGIKKGYIRDGSIFLGQELVTDTEFTKSEYYTDYTCKMDIKRLAAATIHAGNKKESTPSLMMSVYGSNKSENFGEHARAYYSHIVRHAKNSFLLRNQRLMATSESNTAWSFITDRPEAIFILDDNQKILKMSKASEELLRNYDEFYIKQNRLGVKDLKYKKHFNCALNKALKGSIYDGQNTSEASHIAISIESQQWPLFIKIQPIPRSHLISGKAPAVTVIIKGAIFEEFKHLDTLFEYFNITPAERHLCKLMMKGLTINEAATSLKIKVNTARQRLKVIFVKMECHSQAQLIRLLASYF